LLTKKKGGAIAPLFCAFIPKALSRQRKQRFAEEHCGSASASRKLDKKC
jgi:hypothetical protein